MCWQISCVFIVKYLNIWTLLSIQCHVRSRLRNATLIFSVIKSQLVSHAESFVCERCRRLWAEKKSFKTNKVWCGINLDSWSLLCYITFVQIVIRRILSTFFRCFRKNVNNSMNGRTRGSGGLRGRPPQGENKPLCKLFFSPKVSRHLHHVPF